MKKGDIVVCKKCVEDDVYYSKLIKAGGKYEVINSDSFLREDFERIYMTVNCVITNKRIRLIPAYFFMTLEKYRESVLEKLNI
jgi:hypothetical protein